MTESRSESPNGLAPTKKVNVAKMSRWPLYAALLGGLALFGVLFYSVNFAHNPAEEQAQNQKVDISESERPLLMGEGSGLALAPPPGSPLIVPAPMTSVPAKPVNEPLIVVQQAKEQPDQYRQEQDNLRRMRVQAQLNAMSAPLGVKRASDSASKAIPAAQEVSSRNSQFDMPADPYGAREGSYDPAADKDKEAFFGRAQADSSWILPNARTAGQPLEVKTGTVIPGIMITGINSDLPGNIIAQVSQNVWDTATGRNLLVPQGSKLFGVYDSRVVYGQERVLVAWNRIVFPDGSAFTLGAMPGADLAGNAGYTDEVNNHYFRIFGSAILMSLITGGMSYSMDALSVSGNSSDNGNAVPTLQDEMGSALAAQLGQATVQLLQKNLNIKPTLEIRPGYQFNIVLTKDLVFQQPYTAWR